MRLLHQSDWHLGRTLYGVARREDHEDALEQSVALCRSFEPDLVLHTGDLFDGPRPGVDDLTLALDALRRMAECAPVVVLAGNHDSPPLFRFLDSLSGPRLTFVDVARHPRHGGILSFDAARGRERIRLAPVPFISANRMIDTFDDPRAWTADYADEVRRIQDALGAGLLDGYRADRDVLLFAAHLHVTGAQATQSERRLHVSDAYAAHAEAIPAVSYAAFGHIHRPQRLPGGQLAWYAGSPIPLDFGEEHDAKLCITVEAEPGRAPGVERHLYRIRRPLRRLHGTLEEIRAAAPGVGTALCQVLVRSEQPIPELAAQVRDLLPDAVLLAVDEDCAARRLEVLTDTAARGEDAERPLDELFAEYLTEQATGENATAAAVLGIFRALLHAGTDDEPDFAHHLEEAA